MDRTDADILLAFVLGCSRAQLLLKPLPTPAQQAHYESLLVRRASGEPVAYLTGEKEFWSLTLKVTPDVLIPRPETELLVEWVLEIIDSSFPRKRESSVLLFDLGSGSGAIALALAKELSKGRVIAGDTSVAALKVACQNAAALGLSNVEFFEGAYFKPLDSRLRGNDGLLDFVISNPPYIAEHDPHLPALRYEPSLALISGRDGLDAIREIVRQAPEHLNTGGWLLLEHGAEQGAAVRELLKQAGFTRIETRRDLAGHERASAGCRT